MAGRFLVIVTGVLLEGFGQISLGDVCSSLASDDIAPCGSRNTSKASCLAKGCCWNDSSAANLENKSGLEDLQCYRPKHLDGNCVQYPKHGICFSFLNNSVPQFRDSPRFIDNKIGFNRTEYLLKQLHNLVDIVGKDAVSETCLAKTRILLCQYVLTPCSWKGNLIQICRRDCIRFEEECPGLLQKLLEGSHLDLNKLPVDFVHLDLPECKNLRYEDDLANVGKTCYTSGLFSDNWDNSLKTELGKTALTAAVMVAATLVAASLIFGLWCRRNRKREGAKIDPGTPPTSTRPSNSVKDHINRLSEEGLLISKILISDPKQIKQYPVDMITYEKDLGEGQFGQVFQGRAVGLNENDPEAEVIVAVKTLKTGSANEVKAEFEQEACLMNFLSHPNIVKLLAVSSIEEPYCMVFEFLSKGDLSEYLRKSEPLTEDTIKTSENDESYLSQEMLIKMSIDVAKGLQYLASHRFIHRDIATRNCLVADDLTIKIADFGMSRDIYSVNYYKIERHTMLPIRWLSPESIMFGKFTLESDIYSYGVLLWEIFTFGVQPYYGYTNQDVLEFVTTGIHLAKPHFCPEFVYRIMMDCWRKKPELRPDYHSIIDRLSCKVRRPELPEPRSSSEQPDAALYENFSSYENELMDDPQRVGGNERALAEISHPDEDNSGKNGFFVTVNPFCRRKEKQNSNEGSFGNTNAAMDLDTETNVNCAGEMDNKTRKTKVLSDK